MINLFHRRRKVKGHRNGGLITKFALACDLLVGDDVDIDLSIDIGIQVDVDRMLAGDTYRTFRHPNFTFFDHFSRGQITVPLTALTGIIDNWVGFRKKQTA